MASRYLYCYCIHADGFDIDIKSIIIMDDDDESEFNTQVIAGYQEPKVKLYQIGVHDDVVNRLTINDPSIAGLYLFLGMDFDDNDNNMNARPLERICDALATSQKLREVKVYGDGVDDIGFLQSFFNGLARNRSIEKLTFCRTDLTHLQHLAPLFEHNRKLRCIEFSDFITPKGSPSFLSTLLCSAMSHLVRMSLCCVGISDNTAADFINQLHALPWMPNLLDLDLGGNEIREKGCEALRSLLKNPECNLISLDISYNHLGDVCIDILISGMVEKRSLTSLSIGGNAYLTTTGWKRFSAFLSNPTCSLEKLILQEAFAGVENVAACTLIGESIATNNTLKYLDFGYNQNIGLSGWSRFTASLKQPYSTLLELDLDECNIDNEVAVDIFSCLAHDTSLRKLILRCSEFITSEGWVECFDQLEGSNSALEILDFGINRIDDEGAFALVNLLTMHLRVSCLNLWGNSGITGVEWSAFARVLLPGSTSKLYNMRLGDDWNIELGHQFIDDRVTNSFIAAIARNNSLRKLRLGRVEDRQIEKSLDALINVLCNVSSIKSVCTSNHTFHSFSFDWAGKIENPRKFDQLYSLLDLNEQEDKAEVVRQKLLLYFFTVVDNIFRFFGPMPTALLPNVVEWIGRDEIGYSVMFELCRNVPALLK